MLILTIPHRAGAASCFPTPAGLVGWWPGDGNAGNLVGTNNGTLVGGATANAAGLVLSAFSFEGTNNYVQITDGPSLHPTNLTIEAWVRFASLDSAGSGGSPAGDQYIIFKQNSRVADFEGFDLSKTRVAGGDVFRFLIASATGQSAEIHSATLLATGVWYHVAAVRGSNFTQIYVNGVLERQTNVAFAQDYAANAPLYFGTSGQSFWDHKLKGSLDEASLYNRALASNEIAALYAAGAAGKCKGVTISTPPQNQIVVTGNNALFSVAATGLAPLTYQWQFAGSNLAGSTTTSLSLTNVLPANAGNYAAVVSNLLGAVTSAVAVLTVWVPPAITAQPQSATNVTSSAATFNVTATGVPAPAFQWRFNGANISGATGSSFTRSNVQPTDGGAYTVVATNSAGAATSAVAVLTVWEKPTISGQPQSLTNVSGSTAVFTVTGTGVPPPDYQWRFNGTSNIGGATGSSLSLANVQLAQGGSYSVVLSNGAGAVTSAVAGLTIWVQPAIVTPPQSRTNRVGDAVSFSAAASGIPAPAYQWQFNGDDIAGATSAALLLNAVQLGSAGNYAIVATNAAGSITSAVAVLTVWEQPAITAQPQSQTNFAGSNATFAVTATGTPAPAYQWWFGNQALPGATSSQLTLLNLQPANGGPYTVVVTNSAGSVTSAVAVLNVGVPPVITSQPQSLTNIDSTAATFNVSATGDPAPTYQWRFNGNNLAGVTSSTLQLGSVQSSDEGGYSVVVSNYAGVATSAVASLTVWVRVNITSQPQNLTVIAGNTAGFSVAATGTAPLTYQWLFNGSNIAGATAAAFARPNAQPADAGTYSVIVSNAAGAVPSALATLTVLVPPAITTHPQSRTNIASTTASFNASATGTPPLGYQWQFNGSVNLAGATATNLTISHVQLSDAGGYRIIVTNAAGAATSSVAVLTVTAPEFIVFPDPNLEAPIRSALGKPTGPVSSADMISLTALSAGYRGITNLSGLEWAPNLTNLFLSGNAISNTVPLQALAQLNQLGLDQNKLVNPAALGGLTALTSLNLGYNQIADASALAGLTNLTSLWLYGNAISDISFLTSIAQLKVAGLDQNQISNLAALSAMTNLVSLALGGNPVANYSPLNGLANLAHLSVRGSSITNLTAFQGLTWLKTFNLESNRLTTLAPLAGFTNLFALNLSQNPITNYTALAGLPKLASLELSANSISDASFLAPLSKLTNLVAASNLVTDLSPLAGLTNLKTLNLGRNPASNYAPVAGLTSLSGLWLYGNSISNLAFLQNLNQLRYLVLDDNLVADPSPVTGLPDLNWLSLEHNRLAGGPGVSSLGGLITLTGLALGGNSLTNTAFLQNLPELGVLHLPNNPLGAAPALDGVPNLVSLNLALDGLSNLGTVATQELLALSAADFRWNLLDVGGNSAPDIQLLQSRGVSVLAAPQNQPPILGVPNLWAIGTNGTSVLNFFLADDLSTGNGLVITATSFNQSLIPNANILFGGANYNRTISLTPAPNQTGTVTISITITDRAGLSTNILIQVTVMAPVPVSIPDPNLRAAVRAALGKPSGQLTSLDLFFLRYLDAHNAGITNLTGLEMASNLATVSLGGNAIADLAPLLNLSRLEVALLYNNLIADCSPLAALPSLSTLDLGWNPLTNLDLFATAYTHLTGLGLANQGISNPGFLTNRSSLATLNLNNNLIADPLSLAGLPNLVSLDLSYNPLTNFAALGAFGNLTAFYLNSAALSSLSPMQGLTQLTSLALDNNQIKNLSPVAGLTNLTRLSLRSNPATNFNVLASLTNLTGLWLDGNSLSNLPFIQGLTALDTLGLVNNRLGDLSALAGLTNLAVLSADYNRLTNIATLLSLPRLARVGLVANYLNVGAGAPALNVIQTLQSRGAIVTYLPQNQPPVISVPAAIAIAQNSSQSLTFTISDDLDGDSVLQVAAISGNTTLIPNPNLQLANANGIHTLTITPAANQTGVAAVTLTATDQAGLIATTNILVTVVAPQLILIADPNLEIAIRNTLGKPSGTLNTLDMLNLTSLYAYGVSISNLSGLEFATNLSRLFLDYNLITSLTPLQGLTGLTLLSLGENRVADLGPLGNLTNLTTVMLNQNRFASIAPLQNLPKLATLDISYNLLDLAGNSPAMLVIQSLLSRGVAVTYTPQRTPPSLIVAPSWAIAKSTPSSLSFNAFDTTPFHYTLAITANSSNPGLVPNNAITITFVSQGVWNLGVNPVADQVGTTTITLGVTDDAGLSTNRTILLTVTAPGVIDGAPLNAPYLSWVTGGDAPWFVENLIDHDGVSAVQSGAITNFQGSWIQTSVTGPGTLTFWWLTSSEQNYDYLSLTNLTSGLLLDRTSGTNNGWVQRTFAISPGTQVLRWSYTKDQADSWGFDAAWIDEVSFAPTLSLEITGMPAPGQCQLLLHVKPGQPYELLSSSNLSSWATVTTLQTTNLSLPFLHTNGGFGPRFYRLHQLP